MQIRVSRGDVVAGAALVALSQAEVWWYGAGDGGVRSAITLGIAGAAVTLCRTAPLATVLILMAGISGCAIWTDEPPFSITGVLAFWAGYVALGARASRGVALVGVAVGVLWGLTSTQPLELNTFLGIVLTSVVVPWLVGTLWASHARTRAATADQRRAAEDAVVEERRRLARELHDVVSHNVGMIAVQAGAADVLLDKDPVRTRESLQAIEQGAKETLLELRHMLGLLRDDAPERTAVPLADLLTRLTAATARAGVDMRAAVDGHLDDVPPAVNLAVCRLLQESVTNAVAHAGPCRLEVSVRRRPDALMIEVRDDGAGVPGSSRGGYGLAGLRERLTALGGDLEAGPRPEGGFEVRGHVPLPSVVGA
jgi:signal transduction histidine kinase